MIQKVDTQRKKEGTGEAVSAWLVLGLVLTVVAVVGSFWFFGSERFDPRPEKTVFRDVTREWGIVFGHNNGASGDRFLPETMGSGVAFIDYDRDGDEDLLFSNSDDWPWVEEHAAGRKAVALYRNDGDGRFTEVANAMGIGAKLYGMGVAVGDYDNDGWRDVYLTGVGGNRLYRNVEGKRFEDVTPLAGVAGAGNDWSTSAAWLDVNNDGLLDLFVCNYVSWGQDLGIELAFKLAGIGHGYGPQVNFTGALPYLYLNRGDGRFSLSTEGSGLDLYDELSGYPLARSLAVAPIDLDEDGLIDLVVANHEMRNFVFRNLGEGKFEEMGESEVEEGDRSMGVDVARLSGEDSLGLGVGSFANELNQLYRFSGDSLVVGDEAIEEEVEDTGAFQRFGLFFFDYDLDGRLDLLAVNGVLEREINRIAPGTDFRRSAQLFWNAGIRAAQSFREVGDETVGGELFEPMVGRGAAYGDLDGDGSLDVVITQNGAAPMVFKNEAPQENNWVRIRLVGTRSNRDAIGAVVEATVGFRQLMGRVMPTRSYLSQSELPVTIGLGKARRVSELKVYWPSGYVEVFEDVPVNEEVELVEGKGIPESES